MRPGGVVSAAVFAVFGGLALVLLQGNSGPDPAKWLLHQTGFFALALLVATLAVSPLMRVLRKPLLVLWRRPLGLAGFLFASVHVLVYVSVYQGFALAEIIDDVVKRPYILFGLLSWLLLVPLAMTSTRAARRRMGQLWARLHRAVYVIVPLGILHQGMAQKADVGQTVLFAAFAGCFLIERMLRRLLQRKKPGFDVDA